MQEFPQKPLHPQRVRKYGQRKKEEEALKRQSWQVAHK